MFGLSFTHLMILAVIAIVFIGPEQLPEVARTIARLLNEWKRASSDIQSTLTNTLRDDFSPLHRTPPPDPALMPGTQEHAEAEAARIARDAEAQSLALGQVEHEDAKVHPIELDPVPKADKKS